VLSLLQLAIVILLLAAYGRTERRAPMPARLQLADGRRPRTAGQRLWLGANLLVMAVLLGLPLAVLAERSFATDGGHGLAHWRDLAHLRRGSRLFVPPIETVGNSLRFALVASILAVVIGGLAAVGLSRGGGPIARAVDGFLTLPLGTSAVTIGFGFLIALDHPPLDLRGSAILVPIAQALVAVPFVVRTVLPVVRSIDHRLREAAALLGASPWRAWREVDLPIIGRALLVGAGFAFAISLGEFGATLFVARADTPTLPIAIYRLLSQPGSTNFGEAMAMSTVLMVLTAASVLVIERLQRPAR
jgi:thiamine transport system permease protein